MAQASAVAKFIFLHIFLVIVEDLLIIFNAVRFFICGDENWATIIVILPFVPGILACIGFIGMSVRNPDSRKTRLKDALIYLFFPFFHLFRYIN